MKYPFLICLVFGLFQCTSEKSITIVAESEIEVPVDLIIVNCDVSVYGNDRIQINEEASNSALKIQKVLKEFKIEKEQIITLKSDMDRNYYGEKNEKFTANIKYKFPFKSLNQYDALKKSLLRAGSTEIDISERYSFNEDSLRSVAYKMAIQKAKDKAELFLSPMDCKITGITKILDDNFNIDVKIEEVFEIDNITDYENLVVTAEMIDDLTPTTKLTKKINVSIAIQFAYK